MRISRIIVFFITAAAMLTACSGGAEEQPTYTPTQAVTSQTDSPAAAPTPVKTTQAYVTTTQQTPELSAIPSGTPEETSKQPETSKVPSFASSGEGMIRVRDGDTLARDIIPQLKKAFSLSEEQVKDALANADSSLIGRASGFRRMEGIIVPGTYELKGESLDYWIKEWISGAERRYERLAAGISEKNGLSAGERIILASVVEGDTNLSDSYESVVATVYLNRIKRNDRFGSCPTVEYALGYQRPYLTKEDVAIDSKYNTYKIKGLPPGPICCFDDESLKASISKPTDSKLYFFFYDYVKSEILSFTIYDDFGDAADESKALFEATFEMSRFEKMADKREFFSNQ